MCMPINPGRKLSFGRECSMERGDLVIQIDVYSSVKSTLDWQVKAEEKIFKSLQCNRYNIILLRTTDSLYIAHSLSTLAKMLCPNRLLVATFRGVGRVARDTKHGAPSLMQVNLVGST